MWKLFNSITITILGAILTVVYLIVLIPIAIIGTVLYVLAGIADKIKNMLDKFFGTD